MVPVDMCTFPFVLSFARIFACDLRTENCSGHRDAERWASAAAGSGSDAGADAGGSQVQRWLRSGPPPALRSISVQPRDHSLTDRVPVCVTVYALVPLHLPLQPQRGGGIPNFLSEVVGDIVLHVGLMRAGEHPAV